MSCFCNLCFALTDSTSPSNLLYSVFKRGAGGCAAPSWDILVKEHVNLLKGFLGRLWIREEGVERPGEAECAKYHVGLPLDIGKCRWHEEGESQVEAVQR